MSYNLIKFVQEEIDSGIGDIGRLQFILDSLKADKDLYHSDRMYLESRISNYGKKITNLSEPENIFKNNENRNYKRMVNFSDYNTISKQEQQTIFYNKSEIIARPDIQNNLLEVRSKLVNVLERLEILERKLEQSKFGLTVPEAEQNYLSNELHEFTEKQKMNKPKVEVFGNNKNKQKLDKNLITFGKVLLGITIVTIIPSIVILWFFGSLEGKLSWQNHEITYWDVSDILHSLLFLLLLVLAVWPVFGIASIINSNRKKSIAH